MSTSQISTFTHTHTHTHTHIHTRARARANTIYLNQAKLNPVSSVNFITCQTVSPLHLYRLYYCTIT